MHRTPNPGVFLHGTPLRAGGLGLQASTALSSLALSGEPLTVLGPGGDAQAPANLPNVSLSTVDAPSRRARLLGGRAVLRRDRGLGELASTRVRTLRPPWVYGFTQISAETAEWCSSEGVPFILDNPNSHIRNFLRVYRDEAWRWFHAPWLGHPAGAMVRRVEREYELAAAIRVSSQYSKASMVEHGVAPQKIEVLPQFVDLERYAPSAAQGNPSQAGPLRICFVGTLDLRKGFVYLLQAVRDLGRHVELRIAGATGDPWCRRLLEREARNMDIWIAPGDPRPLLEWAEIFSMPSLEDGFGFAAAEAMACGVPVIVSDRCGAAEWVDDGVTGWIAHTAGRDLRELWRWHLEQAVDNRGRLREMGRLARLAIEQKGGMANASLLAGWFRNVVASIATR